MIRPYFCWPGCLKRGLAGQAKAALDLCKTVEKRMYVTLYIIIYLIRSQY